MGKHWARQQVKQHEFQDTVNRAVMWVMENRQKASAIGGGVAAVILVAVILVSSYRSRRNDAWDRLSLAQMQAFSGHGAAAVDQVKQLAAEAPNTPAAAFGLLFAGDILYPHGSYKEALASYSQLVDSGQSKLLLPFALSDMALTQETDGNCAQALLTAQRFLDEYPDHFLAPQVHASLARCQQAVGQADLAKSTLQKIALQYPDTGWAAWAQARMQAK